MRYLLFVFDKRKMMNKNMDVQKIADNKHIMKELEEGCNRLIK